MVADDMRLISSTPETSDAAKASTDDDEVYVVPAFAGLGAPIGTIKLAERFWDYPSTTDKDLIELCKLSHIRPSY